MKKRRLLCRGAALALCLVLCTVLFSGCTASQQETRTGTLTVGVRAEIMNFGYLNEKTGRYYGLEIDLAQALAEKLGKAQVRFVTAPPEKRETLLETGQVDCVIACFSITEDRQQRFDFTAPYYDDGLRVMVESSSCLHQLRELGGCTLGVLADTNAALLVATRMNELGLLTGFDPETFTPSTFQGGVRFVEAKHYADLDLLLERGEVDAVCMDGCIAQGYQNEDRLYLDAVLAPQSYGVATRKGDALSAPMAQAMEELLADGIVELLIDKWD